MIWNILYFICNLANMRPRISNYTPKAPAFLPLPNAWPKQYLLCRELLKAELWRTAHL